LRTTSFSANLERIGVTDIGRLIASYLFYTWSFSATAGFFRHITRAVLIIKVKICKITTDFLNGKNHGGKCFYVLPSNLQFDSNWLDYTLFPKKGSHQTLGSNFVKS